VRRLSVVNSRHLVSARIKTHKKAPKIPTNALSDALLMSGFQIFAADAAIENCTSHNFFARDSGGKKYQEKTDIHESQQKIRTHRVSSKATRLFVTK